MGDPVVHFEVIGKDPAALQDFYKQAFDWEIEPVKVATLGGATMMPPTQVPGGPRIALFTDPEGHAIGLVQT